MAYSLRDIALANKAKKKGMQNSLRIILEARRTGIPISLAFALIEQESTNGANVWGHDDGKPFEGAGKVTKENYRKYKWLRDRGGKGQGGMQGVGPAQLTHWSFQDEADRRGGAWKPKHNISTAFDHLSHLIQMEGKSKGLAIYNAGATNWRNGIGYANSVQTKQKKWHKALA